MISKFIDSVTKIIFPNYSCPFCGIETIDGVVCKNCKMYIVEAPFCKKCGEHVEEDDSICLECKEGDRLFDVNYSAYVYNSVTSTAITKLKYNGAKYYAELLAKILYDKFVTLDIKVDFVCAVPCTDKSKKSRGYNHAEEIAKHFCKLSGLDYQNCLTKIKETPHQAGLSRKERLDNLIGSFKVTDRWLVRDKNILVIDDVFTTGSTMSACAKELKRAKAKSVFGLTVTKTLLNKA